MAKKGKKKSKLPKSVGGVAIPKKWRTAAEKLAENPVVLDVVAAGLLAAAAALTAPRETAVAASAAGDEAGKAAAKAARKASRAKVMVKAAAGAMGKALVDEVVGGKGRGKRAAK